MSISESVALSSKDYPGLEFFISKLNQSPMVNNPHKMNMGAQCHTNDNEEFPVSYAVGMGYYYTGRMRNILDLILCMTNVNDTKFTVRADPNISKKSFVELYVFPFLISYVYLLFTWINILFM